MIKDEIQSAKYNLARLKESYKNLVKEIKETFYDKVEYFVDDSPRKPRGEKEKMQAAICLAQNKCPRSSYDLTIRQAKEWHKGKESKWLQYWIVNQDRFKDHSGTTGATIVIKKNDLRLLKDICKELWIKEVSNSFSPNTLLGFENWLEKTHVDKIYDLMCENLNEVNSTRVQLVTDRSLFLKDIIVIFPKRVRHYGNL